MDIIIVIGYILFRVARHIKNSSKQEKDFFDKYYSK
jgi:hypothetical protein